MKKYFSVFLFCILSLSLISCGKQFDPATDPDLNNIAQLTIAAGQNGGGANAEVPKSEIYEIIGNRATDYDLSEMTAIQFTQALGIGWNLGNTLDATGGDGMNPISQETSWGCPETTQELIHTVAESGFTTIRIPITWTNFTDPNTFVISEKFLERVKTVVDMALDEGLFVIINTHHEVDTWLITTEASYNNTSKQLCEMWNQIGTYFADYDSRLVFEGMNEPRTKDEAEWVGTEETHKIVNKLGLDFVKTIRSLGGNNSTRFLMVPCYAASSNSQLWAKYEWPDDERVIMSIHAYIPYDFALNIGGTDQWNPDNKWDTRDIDNLFNKIHTVLLKNNKAAVIGEMGCMGKGNNIDARVNNATYFATRAAFYKIPFCWWDNNAFIDGETFGLINREINKVTFPGIVEGMFNAWYKSDYHFENSSES